MGFPGDADGKESACNPGDPHSLVGKIPWRGAWQPRQYSGLENPHGQRSLAGCRPWGRTEADTAELTKQSTAHG